jgi:hypothetical protein
MDVVMQMEDPVRRCRHLLRIARAQFQNGHHLSQTLSAAEASVRDVADPESRSTMLAEIAKVQMNVGINPRHALNMSSKAAKSVKWPYTQARILAEIALLQHEAELDMKATVRLSLRAVDKIPRDANNKGDVLHRLVNIYIEANDIPGAVNLAEQIEDIADRVRAHLDIAKAQSEKGMDASMAFSAAIRAASSSSGVNALLLRDIAVAQFQCSQNPEATFAAAREVALRASHAYCLLEIAKSEIEAGYNPSVTLADALTVVTKDGGAEWENQTEIAVLQYQAGQETKASFETAIATANRIEAWDRRAAELRAIAEALGKSGRDPTAVFAAAIEAAQRYQGKYSLARSACFYEIARSMIAVDVYSDLTRVCDLILTQKAEFLVWLIGAMQNRKYGGDTRLALKEFLPCVALSVESSAYACGLIAHYYPIAATDIANILLAFLKRNPL